MLLRKFFLLFALLLIAVSCNKAASVPFNKRPLLLVSIAPYRTFVERIAGSDFDVQTIVPAAANPHAFEPTVHQVSELHRAAGWFQIGEPFESKITPLLQERQPRLFVTDLREGIALLEEQSGLSCTHCAMDHLDRHIWLSPHRAAKQASLIAKTLSEHYPEHATIFAENLQSLLEEFNDLDSEIRSLLQTSKTRTLLVSHPAFGYFCNDYDLTQLSVEYEGKDPRPKHLEEILQKAITESAELALALPQYNNKGAQLIAEKLHKPVRLIDPYSPDYFATMRKLAQLVADPYAD